VVAPSLLLKAQANEAVSTASISPDTVGRLHVLQIVGNAIVGGMETSVERLVERLPPQRVGITALCPFESPFTDRLRVLGADVVITTIADDPSWHSIQLVCALVRASAVDVIQTHLPNAHVLGGIVGRLVDKPVLATIHGRTLTPLDVEVHRAASTHLAVVCRHSQLHALGVGVHPKRLHLLPNGVDTDVFAPGHQRRGALRTRFGVANDAPLVGYVGRLSWEKGPDVFLRAAVAVHHSRPDVHFVLVGEGPMHDKLATFASRFDLDGHVHFAGTQSAMPAVFGELDVMVSTSRSEAMPLAIMEAMASGLPVVACRVGAVPDLVQHGVTGWLANEGDAEGVANHVIDLLDNEVLRRFAGGAGRQRAIERFPLSTHVAQTYGLLTRLAGRTSRGLDDEVRNLGWSLRP
jgi:glycosyltransferase involved in cell wall biosynthesis